MLTFTGLGAQASSTFFTVPATGMYVLEAFAEVNTLSGSDPNRALSFGLSGFGSITVTLSDSTPAEAMFFTARAGVVHTYSVSKFNLSNDPNWVLRLRVRRVGGPDLTTEE